MENYQFFALVLVLVITIVLLLRVMRNNKIYIVLVKNQEKKMVIKTWKQAGWTKTSTNLGTKEDLKALYEQYPKIIRRAPIVAVYEWARKGNFTFLCSNGKFDTAFLSEEVNKSKFCYLMLVE